MATQEANPSLPAVVTVPQSTLTPVNVPTQVPSRNISIRLAPASAADDDTLVSAIVSLVNEVYGTTEAEIFQDHYKRTSNNEVKEIIRDGQLGLALLDADSTAAISADTFIGCVSIKCFEPGHGRLGMLALGEQNRGGGLGRQLAQFAEQICRERGCTIMHVEALVPSTFQHAHKQRLEAWYLRMGYQLTKIGNFAEDYPELEPLLRGPTDYKMFEKNLV